MNANKGQLLKPEKRRWRWTGLHPRATHQGTPSSKTKYFLRESSETQTIYRSPKPT